VGCGDAACRHYLLPLEALADHVEIVGACSSRAASARRLADFVAPWSTSAIPFDSLQTMLAETRPFAVFNLTPAPVHADITAGRQSPGRSASRTFPLRRYQRAPICRTSEAISAPGRPRPPPRSVSAIETTSRPVPNDQAQGRRAHRP
jgi:hypothetical protein